MTPPHSIESFDGLHNSGKIKGMSRPAVAWINLDHLRHNYRLLKQQAGGSEVMAVVKANAYGHGLDLVAPALLEDGCRSLAVTDANEGAQLRQILGEKEAEIILLSGIFDLEDARLACSAQLIPTITETEQARMLSAAGFKGRVWIKIDTGMNRLGAVNACNLASACRQAGLQIAGFMSHLACADSAGHLLNQSQGEIFVSQCNDIAPDVPKSLLNSAGIFTMPEFALDVVRPGIALYGSEPVIGRIAGFKPVMQLTGQVMQIREIQAGESISYGATFTATEPMRIATISLGYGDGLPRALSNCGHAAFNSRKLPITGRVCMDYTMVDASHTALAQGDTVEFWGDTLRADKIAEELNTISYTLFTGVAGRVRRVTRS